MKTNNPKEKIEPGTRDDDFEDDGAYADDFDDEFDDWNNEEAEQTVWYCNGCNWSGNNRPMGGECPKCLCMVEEESI